MKNTIWLLVLACFILSCNNEDDETAENQETIPNTLHSEAIDGDLSNLFDAPTILTAKEGDNLLKASQQGDPRDVDYFSITIPQGMQLSTITVTSYIADPDNKAFIGIVSGTAFLTDENSIQASNLLGGATYGAETIGNDLLLPAGALAGATGFTEALPAGTYSIWLNQTGAKSEVGLNLVLSKI